MKKLALSMMVIYCCLSSAMSQKRLLREAAKLETQGRYEAAFEKYVDAMHHNSTKLETRQALIRSSKKLIDQWLSEYFIVRNSDTPDGLFSIINQIESHQQQLNYFKVESTLPTHYQTDFAKDRERILEEWYQKGLKAKSDSDFRLAGEYFNKIIEVDPGYRDAQAQKEVINTAPILQQAKKAYEQKQIAKAWKLLNQLQPTYPGYQEVVDYKEMILNEYALNLSILPSESNFHSNEYKLRDGITAEVVKLNSPFIQLVDRENMSSIIEEQKLGLSGLLDETTAAEVGRLVGAKAVLFTKVVNYSYNRGELQAFSKIAYRGIKSNGITQYQPVNYKEYRQTNALNTTLQVQLISAETGKVLYADAIYHTEKATINYAEYEGNYLVLYPAKGELIYKSGVERDKFLRLFDANKQATGIAKLDIMTQKEIAQKVAAQLEKHFNSTL